MNTMNRVRVYSPMSKIMNYLNKRTFLKLTTIAFGMILVSSYSHARQELAFTTTILATYSCADSTYGTSGSYWSGNTYYGSRADYTTKCQANHSSNKSSAVVTATQTLRAATAQTVGMISSRISSIRQEAARSNSGVSLTALSLSPDLNRGEVGLAGGNASKGVGVWVQGKWTDVEYDATAFAFDGDITTGMFGIDKSFKNGRVIVGIAAGMEDQDFTTTFNNGTIDGDGFMVSPYVSFNLNKAFSVDAAIGWANMDYDTTRKDAITSEKFTGSTDGDRFFYSAVLNYNKLKKVKRGQLRLGLNAGINHSEEDKDAYTETGTTGQTVAVAASDTDVTQAKVGAEVGFLFKKVEPFVNGTWEWDTSKSDAPKVGAAQTQPTEDDSGYRLGGGLNVFLGRRATATIMYDAVYGRSDYEEHSGTARLRLDF